jgi:hypothetical protein
MSEGFFSQVDYTIDCLAEGTSTLSRARGSSCSPLRGVMLLGAKNSGTAFSRFLLNIIEKTNHRTTKTPILLKLRI